MAIGRGCLDDERASLVVAERSKIRLDGLQNATTDTSTLDRGVDRDEVEVPHAIGVGLGGDVGRARECSLGGLNDHPAVTLETAVEDACEHRVQDVDLVGAKQLRRDREAFDRRAFVGSGVSNGVHGAWVYEARGWSSLELTRTDLIVRSARLGGGIVRDENKGFGGINGKPEYVREACDASLKRLGVDTIDLYYKHRVAPIRRSRRPWVPWPIW